MEVVGFQHIFLRFGCGPDHHGNAAEVRILLHIWEDFTFVKFRRVQIEENLIRPRGDHIKLYSTGVRIRILEKHSHR